MIPHQAFPLRDNLMAIRNPLELIKEIQDIRIHERQDIRPDHACNATCGINPVVQIPQAGPGTATLLPPVG